MKLTELATKIKDQNLTKTELEHLHSELCNLKAELHLELATLKKEKAMYLIGREVGESMASREASWSATERGQRKFEVEGYISSVKMWVESIKSRLFSVY